MTPKQLLEQQTEILDTRIKELEQIIPNIQSNPLKARAFFGTDFVSTTPK